MLLSSIIRVVLATCLVVVRPKMMHEQGQNDRLTAYLTPR